MEASTSDPDAPLPTTPGPPSPLRLWIPIAIVVLEGAALGLLQYAESAEILPPAEGFLFKFSTVGAGTILLFLWFVFLGPVRRKVRVVVGLAGLLSIAAAFLLFRIERVSGDIVPKFAFRFSPRPDELLPNAAQAAESGAVADLKDTTPDDWPQFLGPNRLATLPEVTFDRDWEAHPPKLMWRQPIGAGWSSFAVVGHWGVTQEQRGPDELITCYDIDNGKLVWAQATPVRFAANIAGIGPRSTPTIHEGRVYAMGAMGDLYCLEGSNGQLVWHHNVVDDTDAVPPRWGKSCSPLVYENKVIVSAGGTDGNSLVAYDLANGDMVWSGGDDASAYASPEALTLGGVPQIVIVNAKFVTAHDPADGHVLWQHAWPESFTDMPNVSEALAVGDDRLLLSKGYGVGSALWQIAHADDTWTVEQVWKSHGLKTKFTNAVVRDGYAYGLDEDVLTCIDLATGKRQWLKGRYNHGQVLLVGDLLLVQSESGEVALVEANPKAYHELARFAAVDGQSWNYPALAGRKLLVRTEEEAACWELPPKE